MEFEPITSAACGFKFKHMRRSTDFLSDLQTFCCSPAVLFELSYIYMCVCVHNFLQDCGHVTGCGLKVPLQSNSLFDCSKAWLSDLDKIDTFFS